MNPANPTAAVDLGIVLWFAVGVMWKDKAIMVVHIGAFISLLAGRAGRPKAESMTGPDG